MMRFSVRRTFGPTSLAIVLAGCCFAGCTDRSIHSTPSEIGAEQPTFRVIANGVTVAGIDIGGDTPSTAKQILIRNVLSKMQSVRFELKNPYSGDSYHYNLKAFGGYFDTSAAILAAENASAGAQVPLRLKVDPSLVSLHIGRIADDWFVPTQEPKVVFGSDGARTVTDGHSGRYVDEGTAVEDVVANLPTLAKPVSETEIPFITTAPQVKPDSVLGIDDILTSYTTTFNPGNVTRTNNLLLAIKNINGTVVGPNEVFSYNDSVGPRTQKTGFQDAIIYVDNRMKKDVGGGICQGSSTLYNAVLLANMPIVERHAHSLPVHYVPAGRDATVAWGGDDFKFRNNTTKPIIVRAIATPGGTLSEYLIGDKNALPHPNATVRIDVTPKVTLPDGFRVYSFRIVKEDGVLIAREPLGESFYHNLIGGVPH
jgi:vancomycin resistance protein YoaR